MKRFLILTMLLAVSIANANEIQVFNSNTMDIELDKNTTFDKIYQGKLEDFYKNSQAIFTTYAASQAAAEGVLVGSLNSHIADTGNVNTDYLAAGAIGALAGYAIGGTISWFISDNQYIYISKATNSKGESTMIQTLIVANNFLMDSSIEEKALEARQALIKGFL